MMSQKTKAPKPATNGAGVKSTTQAQKPDQGKAPAGNPSTGTKK